MNKQNTINKNEQAGQMLLHAEDIQKSYFTGKSQELKVLKGIDIQINRGEILAIIGHYHLMMVVPEDYSQRY